MNNYLGFVSFLVYEQCYNYFQSREYYDNCYY